MLASILLTLIRLLQGLAVGVEFTGSMVYLVEIGPAIISFLVLLTISKLNKRPLK